MSVEIPHTEEMGWKLNDEGKRLYIPSKKSFWNRLEFIVTSSGGRLDRTTTGFTIVGGRFTDSEIRQIEEEVRSSGMGSRVPDDIKVSRLGVETPNLD